MAFTIAPSTESVSGRASARSSAVTGPGMAEASSSSSVAPRSAGAQRTDSSRLSSSPCWRPRRRVRTVGTIEPSATSRMAHTATLPSQVTLLPRVSSSCPPPTAASQPSASPTGSASAGAAPPLGSRTGGWLVHPLSSTPWSPRRCTSSSDEAGSVPGPAAQTTRRPAAHDACSRTSPADSNRMGSGASPLVSTRRLSAASSRSRSSSKSAMICSRTGESSVAHRVQVLVGAVQQPFEGPSPRRAVLGEHLELRRGGLGGRCCLHGELEARRHGTQYGRRVVRTLGDVGHLLHVLLGSLLQRRPGGGTPTGGDGERLLLHRWARRSLFVGRPRKAAAQWRADLDR